MLAVTIDKNNHIAVLEPDGPLTEKDFKDAAQQVDTLIAEFGKVTGIVIRAKSFPGWDSIAALVEHLKFLHEFHTKMSRVALATESVAAHLAEIFATHFVAAEIRIFSYDEIDKARQWVIDGAKK